ncbi:MAG: DUF4158 domain-containing protein, partial [Cyanobacteria bacterium]|nr:DUF4158 domain-containing protein [Cyanobacteriota bacterium]
KELDKIFTPSPEEKQFAWQSTTDDSQTLRLLVWLKIFQRLGYFPALDEISERIFEHIAESIGAVHDPVNLHDYSRSSQKWVHHGYVREFLGVTAYGEEARKVAAAASVEAATTRDDLVDIINVAIEELVRNRYELPGYSSLVKIARAARSRINSGYHQQVYQALSNESKDSLRGLFERSVRYAKTSWDTLKREPKKPSVRQLQDFLKHLHTLLQHDLRAEAFTGIPDVKINQFAAEARSLDVASMRDFAEPKRLTLAAALVLSQVGRAFDDVTDMYIRLTQRMHSRAREALNQHRIDKAAETDVLVATLHNVSLAYKTDGDINDRLEAIGAVLGHQVDSIIEKCEKHSLLAGNNYLPLLPKFYKSQRAVFLSFFESVSLVSTSQDQALLGAIKFVAEHRNNRTEWLTAPQDLDLSFISDTWMPLITGKKNPNALFDKVHRRNFELCVFTQVMNELKSGDLCIPLSDKYRDYRDQLISWEDYEAGIHLFGEQAGIQTEAKSFVENLQKELNAAAFKADQGFIENEYLSIENGEPTLKRLTASNKPSGLETFEATLKQYMKENDVLNILWETDQWLNWTKHFGPISGLDPKFENPQQRYVITSFCYGCNLGPTQTARSVKVLDRRQISFINQRHVTEQKLNEAIVTV